MVPLTGNPIYIPNRPRSDWLSGMRLVPASILIFMWLLSLPGIFLACQLHPDKESLISLFLNCLCFKRQGIIYQGPHNYWVLIAGAPLTRGFRNSLGLTRKYRTDENFEKFVPQNQMSHVENLQFLLHSKDLLNRILMNHHQVGI